MCMVFKLYFVQIVECAVWNCRKKIFFVDYFIKKLLTFLDKCSIIYERGWETAKNRKRNRETSLRKKVFKKTFKKVLTNGEGCGIITRSRESGTLIFENWTTRDEVQSILKDMKCERISTIHKMRILLNKSKEAKSKTRKQIRPRETVF